jgi:threonine dehydratase
MPDAHSPAAAAVTYDAVLQAADRLKGRIERTTMRRSRALSDVTGADVWVKYENDQYTAAFKERGALNKLLQLTPEEKKRGVIASSAGNHAQGLAFHGAQLGVPTTIVMPKGTPHVKVANVQKHGATVVLEGDNYDDANLHALTLCQQRNLVFVHPFDDPDVMIGQGTIALEMLEDAPDLDCLIVPIGGGGLIAGIAVAAKAIRPDIRIIGVEAALFPYFAQKMQGKALRNTDSGLTIAEGIAVKKVGENSFAVAKPLIEDIVLVDETALERAIALYVTAERTVTEGAGAASLAALLSSPQRFTGKKCGLVLSGGNIDTRLLAAVLERALVREGRISVLRFLGDDRPGMLADVAKIIGELGANILQVEHHRISLSAPAKGVEFDVEIETRDVQQTEEIMATLQGAGYAVRRL